MRGLFVTGTDTGSGKTVLAAAMVAALVARGESVAASKPVVTGLDEPPGAVWPRDHVLLARLTDARAEVVAPIRLGPPTSPHLAAGLAARTIDPAAVVAAVRSRASEGEGPRVVVVEGAGGLLVPLTDDFLMRDLARELDLPVVVAARPELGTINHSLLTLEAARAVGLHVAGVVMTPWPAEPGALLHSNRETIARLGSVAVSTLPELRGPDPVALAAAGATLPLDTWLDSPA